MLRDPYCAFAVCSDSWPPCCIAYRAGSYDILDKDVCFKLPAACLQGTHAGVGDLDPARTKQGLKLALPAACCARWHMHGGVLNPASMKQALVEGAVRIPGINLYEQGAGKMNLLNSMVFCSVPQRMMPTRGRKIIRILPSRAHCKAFEGSQASQCTSRARAR